METIAGSIATGNAGGPKVSTTGRWGKLRFGLGIVAGAIGLVAGGSLIGRGVELFCARYGALPLQLFALVLFVTLPFGLHLSINRGKRITGRWIAFYLYYSSGIAGGLWLATMPQHNGPVNSTAFLTRGLLQLVAWLYLFGTVAVALWAQAGDAAADLSAPAAMASDGSPCCDHCGSDDTVCLGESRVIAGTDWRCNQCGYEFSVDARVT
jgi:hypothetical protein